MALIGLSGLYALIYVLMRLDNFAPQWGAAASLVLVIYVHRPRRGKPRETV